VGTPSAILLAPAAGKDYDELNQMLLVRCKQDVDRHIRGQEAPVSELWEMEK